MDLRSNFDVIFDRIRDVTLSGGWRQRIYRLRFSLNFNNGLAPGTSSATQVRLNTGLSLLRSKLQLDFDGAYVSDAGEGSHLPDQRWRAQYMTQCCTFYLERLTRDFPSGSDRRDLYFRIDLRGVGRVFSSTF
jgi:hypothetical protein